MKRSIQTRMWESDDLPLFSGAAPIAPDPEPMLPAPEPDKKRIAPMKVSRPMITFTLWTFTLYEGKPLKLNGQTIVFKLDGHWEVREYDPQGFYYGKRIISLESAIEMVSWLAAREEHITQ